MIDFNNTRASRMLIGMLEDKDHITAEHCRNVARLSVKLGKAYGLKRKELRNLEIGALLHDADKLNVPDDLFEKLRTGDTLTKRDYTLLEEHAFLEGAIPFEEKMPQTVQDCQRLHHENYNGTGSPKGLKGEQIPLIVRIMQVADTYDALTIRLPQKKGLSKHEALNSLKNMSGSVLDSKLVEKFIKIMTTTEEKRA